MRILFDQGTPDPLRGWLTLHNVSTTYERGWERLGNGELLSAAEQGGYDLLIPTDTQLRYQQNLKARQVGIVVLLSTSWPRIQRVIASVVASIDAAEPGSYTEVEIPYGGG